MKTPYVAPLAAPDGGRPFAGDRWTAVDGHTLSDDEAVEVGGTTYLAGSRISMAFSSSIPELLRSGDNLFTQSSTVKISVTNMPPVLAARILHLETAIMLILRTGADPSKLVEAWGYIDEKAKREDAAGGWRSLRSPTT